MASFKNTTECLRATNSEFVISTCFESNDKVSCKDAYGYIQQRNYSGGFWSMKSEFVWLCDDSHLAANMYAAQTAGFIFWTLVTMQIIDKYECKIHYCDHPKLLL